MGYVNEKQALQSLPNSAFIELMTSVLHKKAAFRFTAPGHSMKPFINDGDVITIAPGRVRYGDVAAFVDSLGRLTVHRILDVSAAGYLAKGDNTSETDGYLPVSSVIGRVSRVEHNSLDRRLGFGVERIIIAWLSRRGLLVPLVLIASRLVQHSDNR